MSTCPALTTSEAAFAAGHQPPASLPVQVQASPLVREFAILRSKALPLVFAIAPFRQCQFLIRRLNAEVAQCVYLLVGEVDDQPVAREGRTGGPIARFGIHLSNPEFQHFTDVAVIAGPRLTESAVKALECLVARQIAAVGAVRHQSKGAELVNVSAGAWNSALDAFLFFRYAARTMGINFLEPHSPQHPAAFWNCASGIRDRWAPGAFEFRKALIAKKSPISGPRLELIRGDYLAIAERRGGTYWLLAGSEIRATPVSSARKSDWTARHDLISAGRGTEVRGYPDRLELLVDLEVGYSLDKLTKFVFGSAGGPNHWRPLERMPSATMQSGPVPTV
jgi:hypothetical protein